MNGGGRRPIRALVHPSFTRSDDTRSVSLLRSDLAASPRTLVDILLATVEATPDAPALDNGADALTWVEFPDACEGVVEDPATRVSACAEWTQTGTPAEIRAAA